MDTFGGEDLFSVFGENEEQTDEKSQSSGKKKRPVSHETAGKRSDKER